LNITFRVTARSCDWTSAFVKISQRVQWRMDRNRVVCQTRKRAATLEEKISSACRGRDANGISWLSLPARHRLDVSRSVKMKKKTEEHRGDLINGFPLDSLFLNNRDRRNGKNVIGAFHKW